MTGNPPEVYRPNWILECQIDLKQMKHLKLDYNAQTPTIIINYVCISSVLKYPLFHMNRYHIWPTLLNESTTSNFQSVIKLTWFPLRKELSRDSNSKEPSVRAISRHPQNHIWFNGQPETGRRRIVCNPTEPRFEDGYKTNRRELA